MVACECLVFRNVMKKQSTIVYIHGGMTFSTERKYVQYLRRRPVSLTKKEKWSGAYLEVRIGKRFHLLRLRMPLVDNAKYRDWALHFERYLPHLGNDAILIGESLGGIFLAKYLSEHRLRAPARAIYLVCPPFDNTLPREELVGGFVLPKNLTLLQRNTRILRFLFSRKDDVVPVTQARKYAKKLPHADIRILPHIKGHFDVAQLPELVKLIRRDTTPRRKLGK